MNNINWEYNCKRCNTGCSHDYCHDCQMQGYDPSLSNYQIPAEKYIVNTVDQE